MKRFDILSCLRDYLSSTIYKTRNKETGEIILLKLKKKSLMHKKNVILIQYFFKKKNL